MNNFSMKDGRVAFVFDIGGVLLDWNPRYLYSRLFDGDQAAMERFFIEIGFSQWNLRQDLGRTFDEAVAELSARFPHYRSQIEAYHFRWEESVRGLIQPAVDILEHLHQRGYPLYALSNFPLEKYLLARQKYPCLSYFDQSVISAEVGLAKPDPRIYALLLERVQRLPQDCLVIDDSLPNIQAAARLGFQTLLFTSPAQFQRDITNYIGEKGGRDRG